MKILAVDTSGQSLSVALLVEEQVIYECTQFNGLTHSENVMPLIDAALQAGRISPHEVDQFAVVTGPGSYTGVRIGVAVIKAMAQVTSKPCVSVNALEALAYGVAYPGVVCAMRDARAGQVYCAAFEKEKVLIKDEAVSIGEMIDQLMRYGSVCFVGDGTDAYKEQIVNQMGSSAIFAPCSHQLLRASNVAMLALRSEQLDYQSLTPYYLRAPQAERERLAREAQS